jgi:1-acyl-sn-glycerol-3-phosphate acyltransferase
MNVSVSIPPPLPQGKIVWDAAPEPIPFRLAQLLCRIVFTTVFDLKVYGAERFPRTGGVLVVSNHQSMLDPVLLGIAIPRSLSYMAKSELFKNPLFARLISSMGAFPVRQTGSAAGAIKETIDRLQEGRALNIYPEGSRTPDGSVMPFERGTALVVRKAQVPVVPVAIHGSFEAFPTGTSAIKPHPIRLMFGPALTVHHLKPDEITRVLETHVREMYEQLRAHDPMADRRAAWARQRVAAVRRRKRQKARRVSPTNTK